MAAIDQTASGRLFERVTRAPQPLAAVKRLGVRGSPELVIQLADEVPRRARSSLEEARRLARAASWLAQRVGDPHARARALRAQGHIQSLGGRYRAALARYAEAARTFTSIGAEIEVAITDSGSLQPLIYCGEYEEAFARAARARTVFERHGDQRRLARLESNAGNIYFRQDRFEEALVCYQSSLAGLRESGPPADVAVALRNLATCLISLSRFDEALRVYEDAREYCEREQMPLMQAEADYNIGYLYFVRGDYQRALDLYAAAREICARVGDRYHHALCDLDEAELNLELNDFPAAVQMARRAVATFRRLRLQYERGKGKVFLAIASGQLGDTHASQRTFARARSLFVREQNRAWPSLIDLYQAAVFLKMGHPAEARRLAAEARRTFTRLSMPAKAALADVLMARIALDSGHRARALALSLSAVRRVDAVQAPAVGWQAALMLGATHEALGHTADAYAAYRSARRLLEELRSHLRGDELKITFLSDKLAVYEGLVTMALEDEASLSRADTALTYIEEAKSRSFADLIAFRATELPAREPGGERAAAGVREARQQLHGYDHQIERETTGQRNVDLARLARLRKDASLREAQLADRLRALQTVDAELADLHGVGEIDVAAIRAALPPGVQILEYFIGRGTIRACIVSRDQIEIRDIGTEGAVAGIVHLLRFQLGKFRLHTDYLRTFGRVLTDATTSHLERLHRLLIAPVRPLLTGRHLVVIPHGVLHYVPFHALQEDGVALIDQFAMSYAPSARVHYLCSKRPRAALDRSLVLGVGDTLAPLISREVKHVASVLPNVQVGLAADATSAHLRSEAAARSRVVHIATHGFFRREQPMLSAIRLSDGDLTVADVYRLRLSADLVTLSGCGTGLNVVSGGDELVGLTRGFLHAGARAVMVSLWDVHDESAAEFMGEFYRRYVRGGGPAAALAGAMKAARQERPHPYYWAPFGLVGDASL
ncbi:MAG TPA: CHAT domain-containing tetratricopeptide repeat protein [Vicinamibacterales bacterium]|nr:CHAT domain-containing tetratricopeptide repeat protein [Vicinamibacterales bacterium]